MKHTNKEAQLKHFSRLVEKNIGDCQNISVELPCTYHPEISSLF